MSSNELLPRGGDPVRSHPFVNALIGILGVAAVAVLIFLLYSILVSTGLINPLTGFFTWLFQSAESSYGGT